MKRIMIFLSVLAVLVMVLIFLYPKDHQMKTNSAKSKMQFEDIVELIEIKVVDLTSSFDLLEINEFLQIHANSIDYYPNAISFLADSSKSELQKCIVIFSMQSLEKKQYWRFLEDCSNLFCENKLSEDEVLVVIFAGYEWNNLVVVNFYSSAVRKPLKRIKNSKFSTEELKLFINRILSGKALIDYCF